jgi:hypothetical protein
VLQEFNPFNLSSSFAQTSLSISDAMSGFLTGLDGGGWSDLTDAGDGSNGYQGLLEQTACDPGAQLTAGSLLGLSGGAALGATFVGTWGALGLPTFDVGVTPNLHFFYGVTEDGATTFLHAAGPPGEIVTSEASRILAGYAGYSSTVTGIPIISPAGAAAVGVGASNCFTGMVSAFGRGWGL